MSKSGSPRSRFTKPAAIGVVIVLAASLALTFTHTTHKKNSTPNAQSSTTQSSTTGKANPMTDAGLPNVSAIAGQAPVISKPEGTPPATLVTKDIIEGTGTAATSASTVTAHYVLMSWKTGTIIQSSWSQGPATFPLSAVIPGWQQGIPGMKVGGRRLLIVPPALGYGAAGSGPVGANETLVFVVDLTAVK
jgi:peptidylprolyl isomerase